MLVGQGHHDRAAGARLQIFFGHVHVLAAEGVRQRIEKALERRLDRNGQHAHAERGALLGRQVVAQPGGVARGHAHRRDVVRAQRIDRHRQHHRRIDAARQAQPRRGEAVLAAVVARAAHHRPPGQRVDALVAIVHPEYRRKPPARGVEVHHQPLVVERDGRRMHGAVGISDDRGTIEHQRILAADDVDVGQGHTALATALGQQRVALAMLAALVGRGVGHHDDLGAHARGVVERLGEPQVFADHHAHLHTVDLDHAGPAVGVDVEIPPLVEDVVVGQFPLAVGALDLAAAQHAGRVVEHAAGRFGPADDRDDAVHVLGDLHQRRFAVDQKARAHQQVFGRIPADRELREDHHVRAVLVAGMRDHHRDAFGVAAHVTDRKVELGECDSERCGHVRFRKSAGRARRECGRARWTDRLRESPGPRPRWPRAKARRGHALCR